MSSPEIKQAFAELLGAAAGQRGSNVNVYTGKPGRPTNLLKPKLAKVLVALKISKGCTLEQAVDYLQSLEDAHFPQSVRDLLAEMTESKMRWYFRKVMGISWGRVQLEDFQ